MDIQLDSQVLRAGAKDARSVSDGVALARQASNQALPSNAFGLMCSPIFLPTYTLVKSSADSMMDDAKDALDRSASALDAVAADLEKADDDIAQALKGGLT